MLRPSGVALVALGIGALLAGQAAAQPDRRFGPSEPWMVERPQIILFDQPGFRGKSRTLTDDAGNLSDVGFNDHAASIRVRGRWRVCADSDNRGRCEDIVRDMPDLKAIGFDRQISSVSYIGRRPPPPPPPPPVVVEPVPVPAGDALQGATVGLFLRPSVNGGPLPPRQEAADGFCRTLGYRAAIYADYGGRELRDVVCRR